MDYDGAPVQNLLAEILLVLEDAIKEQGSTRSGLDFCIPNIEEFYAYRNPLQYFGNTLRKFKSCLKRSEGWQDVRVVILVDEFQDIYRGIVGSKLSKSFTSSWRSWLQSNYFDAILVGQDVMAKFKADPDFANAFVIAYDERITYLTDTFAKALIQDPMSIGDWEKGDSRYREQSVQRILDLTAGSPFYIQIICHHLVNYLNRKSFRLVTDAHVDYIKNELISNGDEEILLGSGSFDNLINPDDTSPDAISSGNMLKVLKVIADNSSQTDPCPRDDIVCASLSSTEVDKILADLVGRDVVERVSGRYHIRVGLFREWLVING